LAPVVPERDYPSHDLTRVREAVDHHRVVYTKKAIEGVLDVGLDRADIPACLKTLKGEDFHKGMQHNIPGFEHIWLDIYLPRYKDKDLYVKFHEDTHGQPDRFVVRSFKRDTNGSSRAR